jgi:hypothetical protein
LTPSALPELGVGLEVTEKEGGKGGGKRMWMVVVAALG